MTESITSLADLATQANENHQLAESTAGSALEYARKSGAALMEAKALLPHGEWLPWVESNFKGSRRAAQKYMQLSSNAHSYAHLEPASMSEALRVIVGEDEEEEPEEEIPAAFEEALAEVQHGHITDAEELPEEPRAVAVEVVEDEEDDESESIAPPEAYRPAQALSFATMAIAQLERIDKRDEQRKEAFKKVIEFCNKKLNNK
jgi:predicted nucleic acid-binding protein